MTQSLLPQQINVYALTPYAFVPTYPKFNDKLIFGSINVYPDTTLILSSTFAIHYLIAHTTIDKSVIEQTFKDLPNLSWQQIILNYINGVVECLPELEQLYVQNSIRTHLANIENLISNVEKDMLSYSSYGCPLIYGLTKFVRSLYTLFFLNYVSNYNEHPIILDSDNKFEEIAKHITFKETYGSKQILERLEQNRIKVSSIISGIPVSELTKWVQQIQTATLNIKFERNYYPFRDPIMFAIRRRPTTSTVSNKLIDILVLVEFVYTREQVKEIVHLFENLLAHLLFSAQHLGISKDIVKFFQYYYLHFAIPYYSSSDNNNTISVLWIFQYRTFVVTLCDWNDKHLKGTLKYFGVCNKLPKTNKLIDRLYKSLYQFMPPYLFALIVQKIHNQLQQKPLRTYKQINNFQYTEDYMSQFIGSGIINDYVFPVLKQIIDTYTNLTPISLTTFYTPYDVIRFELVVKDFFTTIQLYTKILIGIDIYPPLERMMELLANKYGINELICSNVDIESTDLWFEEIKSSHLTVLQTRTSSATYKNEQNFLKIDQSYINKTSNVFVPRIYLSEAESLLGLPKNLVNIVIRLYEINM